MTEYRKLYDSLLKAEELPGNFTGSWEEDKEEFISAQEILEKIITDQIDVYLDEEDEEQEDFY